MSPARRRLRVRRAPRRRTAATCPDADAAPTTAPGTVERAASYAIAFVVHAVTLLLFVAGVGIVAATWLHPLGVVAGVLLAAATAAAPLDLVLVDGDFNAASGTIGLRRRRILAVGLPLWLVLDPHARVALLAHEVAHQVNGDVRRALVVGSSIDALAAWYGAFRWPSGFAGSLEPLELAARVALLPVTIVISGVLRLQLRLTMRSHRAGELRADRLSAEVASTAAARRCLDATLLGPAHLRALEHESRYGQGSLWDRLRTSAAAIPEGERERLRRVSRRRLVQVDLTHPPTAHRLDALAAEPPHPGRVHLDAARAAAIDRELLVGADRIEGVLRDALR